MGMVGKGLQLGNPLVEFGNGFFEVQIIKGHSDRP
jgi:hypothetical protein